MLIAVPAGAALAYVWMAFGHGASLMVGVIAPMALLGLSFAAGYQLGPAAAAVASIGGALTIAVTVPPAAEKSAVLRQV